jgi:hypothetical protein
MSRYSWKILASLALAILVTLLWYIEVQTAFPAEPPYATFIIFALGLAMIFVAHYTRCRSCDRWYAFHQPDGNSMCARCTRLRASYRIGA